MQESYTNTQSVAPCPVNTYNGYADRFRITRTSTLALRNPRILQMYLKVGFQYMRRLHYDYNKIIREPTIGFYVELSVQKGIDSVSIQSPKGRHMINRDSYF